jgi:hypothetical protein
MRLPASLRIGTYTVGLIVAASGMTGLLASQDWRRVTAACMEIHGTAAMALLVLVGAVAALHVPTGWREAKNRASGVLFAASLSVLLATGAMLYYVGNEGLRSAASLVHWAIGCAALILGGLHVWLGRRSRER